MTAVNTDYAVRAYTPADEPAVLALLDAALQGGPTGRRTAAFFRWKHHANPFGASLALVAEQDGQVIGLRTFMRWRFRADGHTVAAVRAVDTATHPDHQGRRVFTRLTLAGIEALQGDTDLIFNTPNAQSRPGYLKMGWSPVASVPLAVRPVHPWRLLRGFRDAQRGRGTPGGPPPPCRLPTAAAVLADGPAVTELLTAAGGGDDGRITTDRSVAFLRWRYAEAPDLDYRAVTVHEGGRLAGLAIGRPRRRGPLAELLLAEVIVAGDDPRVARRLLRMAARSGLDHVVAHLSPGTVLPGAGRATGYLPAPGVGIGLVVNPLSPTAARTTTFSSWRVSLGDLELF